MRCITRRWVRVGDEDGNRLEEERRGSRVVRLREWFIAFVSYGRWSAYKEIRVIFGNKPC
jgi:hypothetical protein